MLGFTRAAALLQQSLDEESDADEKLSQLAMTQVNVRAEEGSDDDE
jgi:ferritin-like metal-binding protein YciE